MKKTILGLSFIASTLLFGTDNSYTTQFIHSATEDAYKIHNTFENKTDKLLNSDEALENYSAKVSNLESKIENYLEKQGNSFSSKEDAQKALDELQQLSVQTTVLAKTIAYLASHNADNSNKSYNNTLQITSKTILQLSDDIGKMADRIGDMADKIGVMADRIIKTQEIQSKNYNATLGLAKYSLNLVSQQNNANRAITGKNMNTVSSNMNTMSQNSNMQRGTIGIH